MGVNMGKKEIHFTIHKDGSIQSTIKGVKGDACVDIAESIKSLGRCLEEKRTPEYYENKQNLTLNRWVTQ